MEELPILYGNLEVGKAVIQKSNQALKAARDAAFHTPSPKDLQFCPFSDGSHQHGRGGVGVVYRRQWLPPVWTPDQTGTHPNGDFVKKSWAYTSVLGSMVMEAVGVLEGLHAANKTIKRDLHLLMAQDSTVTVKATTDCGSILRRIAGRKRKKTATPTVPEDLMETIRMEMLMLISHGIKVTVELHWCPRNGVPQLAQADKIAGQAMRNGLGYCNVNQESWGENIKSDMALQIVPMISRALPSDQAPEADTPTPDLPKNTAGPNRKERKRERRRAEQAAKRAMQSTHDPHPHRQLPLPEFPLPSKPGETTPAANNTDPEAKKRKVQDEGNSEEAMKKAKTSPPNEENTSAAGETGAAAQEKNTNAAEGTGAAAQEEDTSAGGEIVSAAQEENKNTDGETGSAAQENTNTAAETGSAAPSVAQYACTMPGTSAGMDPETKVFSWEIPGGTEAKLDVPRPSARMTVLSTMEWRQEARANFSMTM